ncbi:uncharacterized protein LOC110719155 [Chenopodium quinoa]|uniref:uncharacterized protein LOC110719155 n=1 Tax=Chenopodium quinoa TaxID=63459 RepID=UPI000B774758|nr:uncharacterized protein LOC110719155 [Chenopodium quinoa]
MGEGDPPPPPKYKPFTDYYLHPSEGSQLVIFPVLLTVHNYEEWSRSIHNNLRSKSKLGFVDGFIAKPDATHADYRLWGIVNSTVVAWIYNTLDSLLSSYVKLPACTCFAATEYAKLHENELLHQFCLGLDPKKFGYVVSILLMSDPLPTMNVAYAKVVADERKQLVSEAHETSSSSMTVGFNTTGWMRGGVGCGGGLLALVTGCDRDHCYELHSFPGGGRGGQSSGKGKGEFAGAVGSSRVANEQVSDSDHGSVPTNSDAQWKKIMTAVKGAKSGSSSDGNKLDLYDISSPVGLPNRKSTTATKEGRLVLSDGLTLDNVLYVPALKCNLLYVSQLLEKQCYFIMFTDKLCIIQDRSLRNLIGAKGQCDGVYIFRPIRARNLQANKVVISDASLLWHRRLWHPSMQVVSSLPTLSSSRSTYSSYSSCSFDCEICFIGKHP